MMNDRVDADVVHSPLTKVLGGTSSECDDRGTECMYWFQHNLQTCHWSKMSYCGKQKSHTGKLLPFDGIAVSAWNNVEI